MQLFGSFFLSLLIICVLIFCVSLTLLITKRESLVKYVKIVLIILLIMTSIPILFYVGLVFYNQKAGSDMVYGMFDKENIEIEQYDISMSIHDISHGGLSFSFENTSNKKYIYGSDYKLYVLKNNVWESLEKIENTPSTSEAYNILPQSKTGIVTVDWSWLIGELPTGVYKFEKRIIFSRSPGDYDIFILAQDFTLP